jgi:hypothetical protein
MIVVYFILQLVPLFVFVIVFVIGILRGDHPDPSKNVDRDLLACLWPSVSIVHQPSTRPRREWKSFHRLKSPTKLFNGLKSEVLDRSDAEIAQRAWWKL